MRYYLIAGEASGDLHGSNLMKGLYEQDPSAEMRFWGGPMMDAVFHKHEAGQGLVMWSAARPISPPGTRT